MKKIALTLALLAAGAVSVSAAEFVPLEFDKPSSKNSIPSEFGVVTVGNSNMQNAILELDSAQIEVRDELLNCKTRYSDIDAKYELIKVERKSVKKQMGLIEARIKRIETAKENIRKNML